MKLCKKCKEEMKFISSIQNGPYYVCSKCNEIVITSNSQLDFGTFDDNELDYISDRGRD